MSRSGDRPSRRPRHAWQGVLLAALGLAHVTAEAQTQNANTNATSIRALQDKGREADKSRSTAPRDAAVITSVPRTPKRPLMRCWQDGKLVFEGGGMTVPAAAASAPIELRNGSGVALQIFDLKSGLCLLDHTTD